MTAEELAKLADEAISQAMKVADIHEAPMGPKPLSKRLLPVTLTCEQWDKLRSSDPEVQCIYRGGCMRKEACTDYCRANEPATPSSNLRVFRGICKPLDKGVWVQGPAEYYSRADVDALLEVPTPSEVEALCIRLKSGDYDGVDIMRAWITLREQAKRLADETNGELLTCRIAPGITQGDELIVDARELLRFVSQYRVVPAEKASDAPEAQDEFVCMHGHPITAVGLLKVRQLQRAAAKTNVDRMPLAASSEGERSAEQHALGSGLRPEGFPCTSPANSATNVTAPRHCAGCGLPATAACPYCDTATCGECANCEHAPSPRTASSCEGCQQSIPISMVGGVPFHHSNSGSICCSRSGR